jgi:putative CocE/NonD family hydrolase
MFAPLPYRDSVDGYTGARPYREWNPAARIADIRKSGVAVYVYGGWFDLFTRDAFLLYANLDAPKKLFVVDSAHKGRTGPDLLALYISEQIRWFDRWLKGMDNGVTDEPPVALQRINGPLRDITRLSDWPPPGIKQRMFYFHPGPSQSVRSANDGILGLDPPKKDGSVDAYVVDYTATSGPTSRWANAVRRDFGYPDMTVNDIKALTYTTPPLNEPLTLLGHPVVSLWIKTAAADVDLFIYLEDVDAGGVSHYVTEGSIRASHRKTGKPPFNNLGLPYQSHLRRDAEPVPSNRVIGIEVDLLPTYYRFDSEHRIRVAVAGADADNVIRPGSPPPLHIKLYRTPTHPSGVSLPVKDERDSPGL